MYRSLGVGCSKGKCSAEKCVCVCASARPVWREAADAPWANPGLGAYFCSSCSCCPDLVWALSWFCLARVGIVSVLSRFCLACVGFVLVLSRFGCVSISFWFGLRGRARQRHPHLPSSPVCHVICTGFRAPHTRAELHTLPMTRPVAAMPGGAST